MIAEIFGVTAPVFLMAFAGYVWARARQPFDLDFVTRLSLSFSVPCLIFATLVKAEITSGAVAEIAVATLVGYGLAGVVLAGALALLRLDQRIWLAPAVFGNTGNVGLPVAFFAYGPEGLALAVVVFAVMAVLSFTIGIWLVAGAGQPGQVLRQPLVYASLAGGAAAITGWAPPDWAIDTLALAGQIAIPLMLLTLGVSIARLAVSGLGTATGLAVLKLAATVGAGWAAATAFGLEGPAFGALILQLAMPAAVTSYLLAARYERDPEAVAGLVVVSTFMSLAFIPALLSVLL
ncbi:MAG: AEC family transporter [Pseudomonadota bacterium]